MFLPSPDIRRLGRYCSTTLMTGGGSAPPDPVLLQSLLNGSGVGSNRTVTNFTGLTTALRLKDYSGNNFHAQTESPVLKVTGSQNISLSSWINSTGTVSWAMWLKFDVLPPNTSLLYGNATASLAKLISNNTIQVVNSVGTSVLFSISALSTGVWYHLAFSRSGGNASVFLNGVQQDTTKAFSGSIIIDRMFGTNDGASTFDGNCGGFLHHTIVYGAPQAAALYDQQRLATPTYEFPMQEGSGTGIYSTGSSANTGTITLNNGQWSERDSRLYDWSIMSGGSLISGVYRCGNAWNGSINLPSAGTKQYVAGKFSNPYSRIIFDPDSRPELPVESNYTFGDGRTAPGYVTADANGEYQFTRYDS